MEALGTVLGAGWASGVNLYGTVLLLGVLGRLEVASTPEVLQQPVVLVVAGALYLLEFVADKVPYLDNAWDVLHTAIRPIGAAVLGAVLAGEADLSQLLGAGVSGVTALGSHSAKAGTRVAVNASPEPASNILVSLAEDGLVGVVVWVAVTHPVVAGVLAVVLLVAGLGLLVVLWKAIRRGWRRLRARTPGTRDEFGIRIR